MEKDLYLSYQEITDQLSFLKKQFEQASQALQSKLRDLEQEIQGIAQRTGKEPDKLLRVQAYLEIAKAHTRVQAVPETASPFNEAKLSSLAVQVGPGEDDPFAAKLYAEARAQLAYLHNAEQRAEKEKEVDAFKAEALRKQAHAQYAMRVDEIKKSMLSYVSGEAYQAFCSRIKAYRTAFSNDDALPLPQSFDFDAIPVGEARLPMPVLDRELAEIVLDSSQDCCDPIKGYIKFPLLVDDDARIVLAEYENTTEDTVLNGIRQFILNAARSYQYRTKVLFVDPVRYSASALGPLSALCGDDRYSLIYHVSDSSAEMRSTLERYIKEKNIQLEEAGTPAVPGICVFHDFPQGYDSTAIAYIQQICANAKAYGLRIVLTHNVSDRYQGDSDILSSLSAKSCIVHTGAAGCSTTIAGRSLPFKWYESGNDLPPDIARLFVQEKPSLDLNNDYNTRVGFRSQSFRAKGGRQLKDIPFGVDKNGVLQTLDFTDSNFATYVCGASRSGKSTFLHTVISGLIQNHHPDDIEIWLIDFKMTEFSRYINHLPVQVRYIILDESPELVYDIIDRLSEILYKRQNIFKGKWLKLDDVPVERYMPAIVVIIDEFSVMSHIISESKMASGENYEVKMQYLLSKGGGLGFHFIFASQGFTSGTQGLNDFSKKQVQQRIAMKTEYVEIRETLDIKNPSEEDKALMEQLPVHYALVKTPPDRQGNHLKMSHVLNIGNIQEQLNHIDGCRKSMQPVSQYDPEDPKTYIDKRALVVDGSTYTSFAGKLPEIKAILQRSEEYRNEADECQLFIGEPRRMLPFYPIPITDEFGENILMIAPAREIMPACSILLSVAESVRLQSIDIELWSTKRDRIYRQLKATDNIKCPAYTSLEIICEQIREIRNAVENKKYHHKFYILLGLESLLLDMNYQMSTPASSLLTRAASMTIESEPETPDLLTQLAMAQAGGLPPAEGDTRAAPLPAAQADPGTAYDARDDLKFILVNGPRLGYHFITVFGTAGDLDQSKLDIAFFKHKILFRTAKSDALSVVGAADATVISDIDDRSFRYTNGLSSLSFRPYLHPGLTWDGWKMDNENVTNTSAEEDEYLL